MLAELSFILSVYIFIELYRSTKKWFCGHEPGPKPVLIELVGDREGALDDLKIWLNHKKDEEYEVISMDAYSLENALYRLTLINKINPNRRDVGVYLYLMPERRILRYETLDVFTEMPSANAIKKIQSAFERLPFPQDNKVARDFGKLLKQV